jgi:RNA polymerase sigma factor (sigma-70 family)
MTRSLHTLIQYLRHSIPHRGDVALTDAQLLERWIVQHDPAAFELILWRHGPMVLNTCRRLLPRREDVEDAFQATFLVFVRKAGSIRRREALAAWLHRVACRIAGRTRAANVRRAGREKPIADAQAAPHVDTPALRDLHAILDEEIESLPAHYRRALILCCLEGKSQEEAARLLERPRGTVSSWLTRGRERLRQRLLRRGIVVSTAALAAALTPDALASGCMIPLASSLVRMAGAVAAGGALPAGLMSARSIILAEGVLRMMFLTKVKIVAAIALAVAVAAAGVGTWSHTTCVADDRVHLMEKQAKEARPKERLPDLTHLNIDFEEVKEEDNIAWGEKAHGLQAGIAFRRGDQEAYEVGQSVTFVVYLRNVSDKKIDLSHIEAEFDGWRPVVEDAEGRRLAVATGPIRLGRVPIVHRNLEAGQLIILGYPWFRIRPLGWRGQVRGPTCCAEPGRYKVGYTGLPLRLSDGKDISLGTKQVELDIRKRETAKEEQSRRHLDSSYPSPHQESATAGTEKFFAGGARNTRGFPPLYYISTRSLSVPISVDRKNKDIAEFILFFTGDRGKSFQQVSTIPADAKQFLFKAPGDGMYWFIVQQVDKQGRCEPANLIGVKPDLGVCVDTTPPVVTLQALRDRNTVHLAWTAKDANLEEKAVQKLEWSNQKDGPWSPPILSGPLTNTHHFVWNLPDKMPSDFYVRIHVRDKAGNDGYAVAYIKLKSGE